MCCLCIRLRRGLRRRSSRGRQLTCKLAIDGKKGKSDGPGQGQGPGSGSNTHGDGMGMAPPSSIAGQDGIPDGIGLYEMI
ncbi:hypothetical protein ACFX2A_031569 [Malus domestica]